MSTLAAEDVVVREDEEGEETLKDFLVEQVDKFFVDHIPVDFIKELDSTCKSHYVLFG